LHPELVSLTSPTGSTQLNSNQNALIAAETVLHACYGLKTKGISEAAGIGLRSFGRTDDTNDESNRISKIIKKLEKDTAVKVTPKKVSKRSSKPMSLSKSSKKKAVAIKKSAKKKAVAIKKSAKKKVSAR
jgi:hypothetical protein